MGRSSRSVELDVPMTFLVCLIKNKSHVSKLVQVSRCLGLLKQDYHQRLGSLIGYKRIPLVAK